MQEFFSFYNWLIIYWICSVQICGKDSSEWRHQRVELRNGGWFNFSCEWFNFSWELRQLTLRSQRNLFFANSVEFRHQFRWYICLKKVFVIIFITSISPIGLLSEKQLELELPGNVSYLCTELETHARVFNSAMTLMLHLLLPALWNPPTIVKACSLPGHLQNNGICEEAKRAMS